MLLKITRINSNGEQKECVIDTEKIQGIVELHNEPTHLYNENGEIVETRETPRTFKIVFKYFSTTVSETTYTKLLEKLKVETL